MSTPKAYKLIRGNQEFVVAGGILHEVVELAVEADLIATIQRCMDYSGNWTSERPRNYIPLIKLVRGLRRCGLKETKDLVDIAVSFHHAQAPATDPEVALQQRDDRAA